MLWLSKRARDLLRAGQSTRRRRTARWRIDASLVSTVSKVEGDGIRSTGHRIHWEHDSLFFKRDTSYEGR